MDALQIQFDIFSEETLEGFISSVPPRATVSLLLEENKAFPAHLEGKAWIQLTGRENAFLLLSLSLRQWLSLHTKVTPSTLVGERYQAGEAHAAAAATSVTSTNTNINCAENGNCFK